MLVNVGEFVRIKNNVYKIVSEDNRYYYLESYKNDLNPLKITKKTGKVSGKFDVYAVPLPKPDEFLENIEKENVQKELKRLKRLEEENYRLKKVKEYNTNLVIYPVSESEFENLYYCKVYDEKQVLHLVLFYAHTVEKEVLEDNKILKKEFVEIKPISFSNKDNVFRLHYTITGDTMKDCIFELLK